MRRLGWVLLPVLVLVGCSSSGHPGTSPAPTKPTAGPPASSPSSSRSLPTLTVSSPQWHGALAPPVACSDDTHLGHSPALSWRGAPAGTSGFAITVVDSDADGFVHWAVLGLPSSTRSLPEGASPSGAIPDGAEQLDNGFGQAFYGGPCPPRGKMHHYVLTVWAVKSRPSGLADIEQAAIASGSVTATYSR